MTGASCPANYTVDFSQPISNYCKVSSNKDVTYQPGSAERVTGCCSRMMEDEDGNEFCRYGDDLITTYACVPICTASAPAAPTLMSPANASSQSSTTASLLWNSVSSWGTACTGANNQYYVYLGTTNPPNYFTTVASNVTSLNAGNLTRGSTYYWQITASNGQLYSSSGVRSFTILNNQIAGTVFYDAANNCGGAGWSTGGVAVSLNGGSGNAVSGTGTFSIAEPLSGPHTLAVSIPAGFICSTAAGCNSCSKAGINSPSANNNFYLTDLYEAWWQAEGAGVYVGSMAGGVTIRSELPTALTKLILPGAGGTSAALLRASGQTDLGAGSVSTEGWSTLTRYRGKRMDYQYFAARMGVIRGVDKL